MKILSIVLTAILLSACGGGSSKSTDLSFTTEEITNSVLISKSILNFNVVEEEPSEFIGTINLFAADNYREVSLSTSRNFGSTDGDADTTEQPWEVLSNGDLQFNYSEIGICNATKQSDDGNQIEVTGGCEEDNTLELKDTLVRPIQFDQSDLAGKSFSVGYEGDEPFTFSFSDDGFLEVLDNNTITVNEGTIVESSYKNVIRVDYMGNFNSSFDNYTHSLFILVAGSLDAGSLIEMTFIEGNVLRAVHVRNTFNNSWQYPIGDYYNNNSFEF